MAKLKKEILENKRAEIETTQALERISKLQIEQRKTEYNIEIIQKILGKYKVDEMYQLQLTIVILNQATSIKSILEILKNHKQGGILHSRYTLIASQKNAIIKMQAPPDDSQDSGMRKVE